MILLGANPYIVDMNGKTNFETYDLEYFYEFRNIPQTEKSVYFTTQPLVESNADFLDPWFYRTGVFNGKFDEWIGQGSSGTVISGEWAGKKAAFKFVGLGKQKYHEDVGGALEDLNEKLSEMTSIQATNGPMILPFYGHYR